MNREEVQALLERERFVYQRMELPFGFHTSGEDRSSTARRILPERMEGASVLDIGCCYGYFLYEARRRGATRLVGLDTNPERLRQAKLLQDVLDGHDLELSDDDFVEVCGRERFDYVLLLNVIHHLKEPTTALRVAARAAKRALIIEFPTPRDPKFGRDLPPGVGWLLSRFPVIGVSSLERNGQTFIFSRLALEAVLTEHERLVDRIDFLQSPKQEPGRLIAIAHTASDQTM